MTIPVEGGPQEQVSNKKSKEVHARRDRRQVLEQLSQLIQRSQVCLQFWKDRPIYRVQLQRRGQRNRFDTEVGESCPVLV